MNTQRLFITGAPRSGTTLIDKILWNMAGIDCFSQPLPLLLTRLKSAFLQSCGVPEHTWAVPLNDLQFENACGKNAFCTYLGKHPLDSEQVNDALQAMQDYSGQYFKPQTPTSALTDWQGGDLAGFAAHYFEHFAQKPKQQTSVIAWKEIGAEEFIPFFIGRGMKAIIIVRDPRDSAASLYYGRADRHAGDARPLLFMTRQWRKSAAFFTHYANHKNVLTVRYEDLVQYPGAHVQTWCDWLGIEAKFDDIKLQAQDGKEWQGNSSFDAFKGVSPNAIGRHSDVLSDDERSFIEALCFSEMTLLGYQPHMSIEDVETRLIAGPKKDHLGRKTLAHYAYDDHRREEECNRWQCLLGNDCAFDPVLFLFEDNYTSLRKVLGRL